MRRFFRILWSNDLEEKFLGDHPYALPRFVCNKCECDYEAEVSFPWVDPKQVFDAKTLRLMVSGKEPPKSYGVQSYRTHAAALQKAVGEQYLVPPGALFGKFMGKVRLPPHDLEHEMHLGHMLFAKRSVAEQLNKLGFNLQTFDLDLKREEDSEKFVEIWAPPVGSMADAKFCTECNRSSNLTKLLKATSVPKGVHLLCCGNDPRFLIMTESLVNKITQLGFTGLKFKEMQVV